MIIRKHLQKQKLVRNLRTLLATAHQIGNIHGTTWTIHALANIQIACVPIFPPWIEITTELPLLNVIFEY